MSSQRHEIFSLHELLMMAALAALGGATSSVVSMLRAAAHALIVLPGGMQYLAGIHVLWLVLAVGLVRKPGAATVTALLKGGVELLSGSPHGLLVLLYSSFAGVSVDAVWLMLGGRDRPFALFLAGGIGAASNLFVLLYVASLPAQDNVLTGLAVLAVVAFISGGVLAGLLGWWLLQALGQAGVVGAARHGPPLTARHRAWRGVTIMGVSVALLWTAIFLATSRHADVSGANVALRGPGVGPTVLAP